MVFEQQFRGNGSSSDFNSTDSRPGKKSKRTQETLVFKQLSRWGGAAGSMMALLVRTLCSGRPPQSPWVEQEPKKQVPPPPLWLALISISVTDVFIAAGLCVPLNWPASFRAWPCVLSSLLCLEQKKERKNHKQQISAVTPHRICPCCWFFSGRVGCSSEVCSERTCGLVNKSITQVLTLHH